MVEPSAVSDALSSGTTTFPFGWTTGWPPITPVLGVPERFHVRPPSVEKEICRLFPLAKSSQTV
jgi:hypothetical protein